MGSCSDALAVAVMVLTYAAMYSLCYTVDEIWERLKEGKR